MTDYEIDRTLAENVMGWPVIDDDEPYANHAHKGGIISSTGTPGVIRRGIIPQSWSPSTNRNHLTEVLTKLTDSQKYKLHYELFWRNDNPPTPEGSTFWLLTCDPAIIAKAVARVVVEVKHG